VNYNTKDTLGIAVDEDRPFLTRDASNRNSGFGPIIKVTKKLLFYD